MNRDKQIEEIRNDIFDAFGGYAKWEEDWQSLAEAVYNAGYRKAPKVASGIFEEIYEDCFDQFGYIDYAALAELKNKYTEGTKNE